MIPHVYQICTNGFFLSISSHLTCTSISSKERRVLLSKTELHDTVLIRGTTVYQTVSIKNMHIDILYLIYNHGCRNRGHRGHVHSISPNFHNFVHKASLSRLHGCPFCMRGCPLNACFPSHFLNASCVLVCKICRTCMYTWGNIGWVDVEMPKR